MSATPGAARPSAAATSGPTPLERARALDGLVRASAASTERLGTMAPEVVDALRAAGLFWVVLPAECGGGGHDLLAMMGAVEAVSRADGSTGWALMANCLITGLAGAFCDDAAVAAIYGGDRLPVLAGMLGPSGTAVRAGRRWSAQGSYRFGSGALHADWLGAGVVVTGPDGARRGPDGAPVVLVCIVARSAVRFAGNWDAVGLVGTGSVDYELPEVLVEPGFTFERTVTDPLRGGSWFAMGVAGFACAGHSAVALGIAARALEEVAGLASAKRRPGYSGPIGEHPIFQQDFSRHEAMYQAARRYSFAVFAEAQAELAAGRSLREDLAQRVRQSTTYAHQVAADVVRFCYGAGGSDALRRPSALGRAMLDISGATQHVFVDPITMVDAAPALLAQWAPAVGAARAQVPPADPVGDIVDPDHGDSHGRHTSAR